jgi:hypothetical protein
VEAERRAQLQTSSETSIDQVRQLMQRKGIGIKGAWLVVMAFFGWRTFTNRREVGGVAGFTPTPYHSGERAREQGMTKSGNRPVRWMTTELAWSWLRLQPDSALSVWCRERFGGGGTRLRRIGMVAVARKLLMALWRFTVVRDWLAPTLHPWTKPAARWETARGRNAAGKPPRAALKTALSPNIVFIASIRPTRTASATKCRPGPLQ